MNEEYERRINALLRENEVLRKRLDDLPTDRAEYARAMHEADRIRAALAAAWGTEPPSGDPVECVNALARCKSALDEVSRVLGNPDGLAERLGARMVLGVDFGERPTSARREPTSLADRNQPPSRRPEPVQPHDGDLPDRNDKNLTLVRELGFDNFMCAPHGSTEKVFFLGPQMLDGREVGAHATEEAVRNFIDYFENQIAVARDYLANGRNNKTHEWTVTAAGNVEAERNETRRLLRDAVRSLELLASHDPPWNDDHVRSGAAAEMIKKACPWWRT